MRIFFFMICVFLVVSCSKEDNIPVTVVELNIEANQELRYYLGNRPTEGGYSIAKQAKSYRFSEILMDEELGGLTYVYLPKQDFRGTDIVEINLKMSSGNQDFNQQLIVLRITIE